MPHRFPRAVSLRGLGVLAVAAVVWSFAPALQFEWVPTAVLDTLTPSFEPAGAQELPVAEPEDGTGDGLVDEHGHTVTTDRHQAADLVAPFDALAVTFDAVPTEPVFVRVHEVGGAWTPWIELEVSTDHAEDGEPSTPASEPVFVGAADAYELNVPSGAVGGAEVVLIRDELRRAVVDATPLAGAAMSPSPVPIRTRGEWGARAARNAPGYGNAIRLTVVHHSVTTNSYSAADVPAQLRSIQAFHMDSRGWSDIGYNFAVDKYGNVWEARGGGIDRPVVGAHAAGFNTNSVGIVVLGDHSSTGVSTAARESVARLAGWKMFLHGSSPAAPVTFNGVALPAGVVGHRDVGSTACPGSGAYSQLPWLRTRAQEWTNWLRATSVPFGHLDAVSGGWGTAAAQGWAIDPDAGGPSPVRVSAGGIVTTVTADRSRPDVGAVYPAAGPDHGFVATLSGVPPGYQDVCATIVNLNGGTGDVSLGCRGTFVGDPGGHSPLGRIDLARGETGAVVVAGTAADPDAPGGPLGLVVQVDGVTRARTTTDAAGAFRTRLVGVTGGRRRICVEAVNVGPGTNLRIDCKDVEVAGAAPAGRLEWVATNSRRQIGFRGWAYDLEAAGPIVVRVSISGRRADYVAAQPRPDVAFPTGYGDRHGFSATVGAPVGSHTVCASAIDVPSGTPRSLGCRQVVVK